MELRHVHSSMGPGLLSHNMLSQATPTETLLPTDAENIYCKAPSISLLPLEVEIRLGLLQECQAPWKAGAAWLDHTLGKSVSGSS